MRRDVSHLVVAVLGASGATGRLVVTEALCVGHDVVAVVRRPGVFALDDHLREAVWPSVDDGASLREAFAGVDVVISTLGGAEKGPTSVCTDAMRVVVPAMQEAGVGRLIAVSAHGVLESHDRSLYSRAVWAGVGERMKDKESMEPIITASPLEWTIVRPPALKDTPRTGTYQARVDLPIRVWDSISRADLAEFLVREADRSDFVRARPRLRR